MLLRAFSQPPSLLPTSHLQMGQSGAIWYVICVYLFARLSPFTSHKLVNPDRRSPKSLKLVGVQLKGSVTESAAFGGR